MFLGTAPPGCGFDKSGLILQEEVQGFYTTKTHNILFPLLKCFIKSKSLQTDKCDRKSLILEKEAIFRFIIPFVFYANEGG